MKFLILGATGLVGRNTLAQALAHPTVTQVIAPTRKPLPHNSKLTNPVSEQLELFLPEALTWGVDAVICAMGTTIGKAGSKEAFRQVDYVLPLAFAKLAHQQGGLPGSNCASWYETNWNKRSRRWHEERSTVRSR